MPRAEMTVMDDFQIGVNYWPARSAMRMWKDFDSGEVREDFARMAEFRLSPVRIFLLWEDFQPEPFRISNKALDRLVQVCSHAADFGSSTWITLFTGHVGGANWLPDWILSPDAGKTFFPIVTGSVVVEESATGVANPYQNPDLRRAQRKQIKEVLSALKGHPALWGWDLGSRQSNVFRPAGPDQGRSWMKEMTEEIKLQDDVHPVTFSLQPEDLIEDRGIGPADAAQCCDLVAMQAPACVEWSGDGTDALFPSFLAVITSWLAGWKPVWISEFGIPAGKDPLPSEEQAAQYAASCLDAMKRQGVSGALWWCYGDFDLRGGNAPFNILLNGCGAFRSDGKPKETAAALAGADRKTEKIKKPPDWIDIGPDEYWRDPGMQIRRLLGRFRKFSP